jgi:hypothetical protein
VVNELGSRDETPARPQLVGSVLQGFTKNRFCDLVNKIAFP